MAQVINIREYPLSTSLYLYYQYTRPNGVIVVNTPTGSYDLDTVNATLTQTYQGSSNTTKDCLFFSLGRIGILVYLSLRFLYLFSVLIPFL